MFVLADCYHPDCHRAWPSIPSLAKAALMSDRQVRRILRSLETKGVIEVTERRGAGHTNSYRFPNFSPDATTSKPDTVSGLPGSESGQVEYRNRTSQPAKPDTAASGKPKGTEKGTERFYERQLADLKRAGPVGDFARRFWREQLSNPEAGTIPELLRSKAESLLKVYGDPGGPPAK
jgi:hypothetical protein